MSLIARHLEANGLPTMCLGSALDIVTAGNPPRATFVDYPFGHAAGKPFDLNDQLSVVREALAGFESMTPGAEIRQLSNVWSDDIAWRTSAARSTGEDSREPRSETPQFQFPADRDAAIAHGSL